MKFRTEIDVAPMRCPIGYDSRIFAVGSCFAENISARLERARFRISTNPTGILFNPASIAALLTRADECRVPAPDEIVCTGGRAFSFDAHSSLSRTSAEQTLDVLSSAICEAHNRLKEATHVLLTFGTAWIYTLKSTCKVVANCHKQPQSLFERKRLEVTDIINLFDPLLGGMLGNKSVIMTVSPVRHTADGLADNFASKATLRLAIEELAARHSNVEYFPAFEIVNDDLRDYRFYGEDLVHPTPQAVGYIWEHFVSSTLTDEARALLSRVEKVVAAAEHRPFDSTGEEYKAFVRRTIEAMDALPQIDFGKERDRLCQVINKK